MITRRHSLRTMIALHMLRAGYPHIFRRMIPRKRRSWLWKADELALIMQKVMNAQFDELFRRESPLWDRLRSSGAVDGEYVSVALTAPFIYPED